MKNMHPSMFSVSPPPETGDVANIEDAMPPAAAPVDPPPPDYLQVRSPDTESPDAFEERFFVYS